MSQLNTGLFTAPNAREYLEREPEMIVDRISGRLWTISDGVRRTIFLEGDSSVVAFDTFGTPGAAKAYHKAVEATIPGKPIGTVIYSHDHLDHAGFAEDFAPEAEIIADDVRQSDSPSPGQRAADSDPRTQWFAPRNRHRRAAVHAAQSRPHARYREPECVFC